MFRYFKVQTAPGLPADTLFIGAADLESARTQWAAVMGPVPEHLLRWSEVAAAEVPRTPSGQMDLMVSPTPTARRLRR